MSEKLTGEWKLVNCEPDGVLVRDAMQEFPHDEHSMGLVVTLKTAIRRYIAAASALAPAAEPTDMERLSIEGMLMVNSNEHPSAIRAMPFTLAQWHRIAAALASPVQPSTQQLGVLHQSPDGRVFRSFPATDAVQPQAPSEAVAWTLPLPDGTLSESMFTVIDTDRKFRIGEKVMLYAAPSAGTPEEKI